MIIEITNEKVLGILEKHELSQGIKTYKSIMDTFWKTDVSVDVEFQGIYREFYQMRRFYSDEFAAGYFSIMEKMKNGSDVCFESILLSIQMIQGSCEPSFASKMLHTLRPEDTPIWDSRVTKNHFGITAPTYKVGREQKTCEKYTKYRKLFAEYMDSNNGQAIIRMFDERYPDSGISNIKKVDFVLWQDR